MKIFIPVLAALSAALLLGGCASLLKGTHEKLVVRTSPAGALCEIHREGEGMLTFVATPGAAYIRRDADPVTIVCRKEGYERTAVRLSPTRDILAGGGGSDEPFANTGFLLDTMTGAIFDLPDEAQIVLRAAK